MEARNCVLGTARRILCHICDGVLLQDWDCDPLDRRAVEVNVGKKRLTFEGTEPKTLTIEIEKDRVDSPSATRRNVSPKSRDPKTPFDVVTATMLGSSGCTGQGMWVTFEPGCAGRFPRAAVVDCGVKPWSP